MGVKPSDQNQPTEASAVKPRRRGRPPRISHEDVLAAAAAIPFDDVTIEAVAERLGVTRAAIYRYVASSDDLRMAAASSGVSKLTFTGEGIDQWEEWFRSYCHAMRDWLLENIEFRDYLPLSAEVVTAGGLLEPLEGGIGLLLGAGFSERNANRAIQFLSGIVWNNAQDEMKAQHANSSHHPLADQLRRIPTESLADRPRTLGLIQDREGFDAKSRFDREIDWAIIGLASELNS